jgi:signal transduction histidine kinase
MYAMINGVLSYASMNGSEKSPEDVDLNKVIKHILIDLEVLINEKKAAVNFGKLPQIHGNADLLYQLFYNLVNNALKFSRDNVPSKVDITSTVIEHNLQQYDEITVADNGIGFDQDYAEKIFGSFFRLNAKDKYEGSGLGLALCKKIVELHHGTITAKGEKSAGAEFKITIPKK